MRISINEQDWAQAYLNSLKYWANVLPQSKISSVFFGGGTPSLMSEGTVDVIIETIFKLWNCETNLEISLEANPTSVEIKKFKDFRKAGINRISIGIQALNNSDLRRLGRLHTVKEAKDSFAIASQNFPKVSFDLIYGRQQQTLTTWEKELFEALKMSDGHLSLYQLTIEENTRFGELFSKNKLVGLPNDEASVNFYNLTNQICESENLHAYELSNHAKLGEECKHNLNYWRGGSFLGIGPGAHGRIDIQNKRYRTETPTNPEVWLKQVQANNFEEFTCYPLSSIEHAEEYVMMGLRLREGFNMLTYSSLAKKNLPAKKINKLLSEGLIEINQSQLKTTQTAKILTNYVINRLLC